MLDLRLVATFSSVVSSETAFFAGFAVLVVLLAAFFLAGLGLVTFAGLLTLLRLSLVVSALLPLSELLVDLGVLAAVRVVRLGLDDDAVSSTFPFCFLPAAVVFAVFVAFAGDAAAGFLRFDGAMACNQN